MQKKLRKEPIFAAPSSCPDLSEGYRNMTKSLEISEHDKKIIEDLTKRMRQVMLPDSAFIEGEHDYDETCCDEDCEDCAAIRAFDELERFDFDEKDMSIITSSILAMVTGPDNHADTSIQAITTLYNLPTFSKTEAKDLLKRLRDMI